MKTSPHELKVQLVWGIFVRWGALALADRESVSPVVTVRKGYNAKHLRMQGVIVRTIRPELYEMGVTKVNTFTGCEVVCYDKERCVCDIIKNRNKCQFVYRALLWCYT